VLRLYSIRHAIATIQGWGDKWMWPDGEFRNSSGKPGLSIG
jgi:hypothetical protein